MFAFVLLGLLPCIAITWLSFSRTRQAMTQQIARSIDVEASTLQADIDRMIFERLQNAFVWSRSELMQDLRVGDVDKRVSHYLVDLARGYGGVYRELDCRLDDGLVVASSRVDAIGRRAALDAAAPVSIDARLDAGDARLMLPAAQRLADGLPLVIETPIHSAFGAGATIARLHLEFDAGRVSRLLDRYATRGQLIAVIDAQGRWVAGSQGLRGRELPDAALRRAGLAFIADATSGPVRAGAPWLAAPAIVGIGRSQPENGFAGSGWTTVVLEPLDEALAPVRHIAVIFAGLLATVLLASLVAAPLFARVIARPIAALIATARRFQLDGTPPAAPARSWFIAELAELEQAQAEMIGAVQQSRQELVRASKLAMLGEVGAVLAHEVRTPLGILRSSAQMLRRDPGLGAEGRELMGFIESETERLNRLVSAMLDTARPRRPNFSACDLHELLGRCAQMQALRPGGAPAAGIELELAAADPRLEADPEQLMQAVFNLLQNATQSAGAQGRVRLATAADGDVLTVVCDDDGPGIAPEIAERIFDPFVTRREGGIGLGLAVVQQVVLAHGGRVGVARGPRGGSAFTLRLPRRRRSAMGARA